jgi:small subunit ribosomal protein S6
MISHEYELIVIANAQLDEAGLAALNERVSGWITAGSGIISNTNIWGRRQLAYAIGKNTAGVYVQFNFTMDPAHSRELDRSLRIDEQVVRHQIVRLDED